jgi:FAD/FMN-containing dehydrogenase
MTDWKAFFEGILTERQIKEKEVMSHHTTYGIGGPADVFVTPQNENELVRILQKAADADIPVTGHRGRFQLSGQGRRNQGHHFVHAPDEAFY